MTPDGLAHIVLLLAGGGMVWFAWRRGYKAGLEVGSMLLKASRGEDPLDTPEDVDEEPQEDTA